MKDYLIRQYHPDTSSDDVKMFSYLYNNHPKGIKHMVNVLKTYPIFIPDQMSSQSEIFNVPNYQFMSRMTKTLWIQANRSRDESVNNLLTKKMHNKMIEQSLHLSQEQQDFNTNDQDHHSDNNDNQYISDYQEQFALFKHAHSLCGNNFDDHKEFHSLLSRFVQSKEIHHNDNDTILSKRKIGDNIIISSNKIVNNKNRSAKRKKASYEK